MRTPVQIKNWSKPVIKDENVCDCRKEPVLMTYKTAIIYWQKEVGDKVAAGECIAEGELEKQNIVIEAPVSGILTAICVENGEKADIKTILGYIDG